MTPFLIILAVVVVGLPVFGLLYERRASAKARQMYLPPGTLVDVGGYRLHSHCMGRDNPGPVVVFESGSGGSGMEWLLVQQAVAAFAPACVYDRAGYGWSDDAANPRTLTQIADELHTLLVNADLPRPVILVGHSFGGINVRVFAARYPGDVAGIVLVDSSSPERVMSADYDLAGEVRRLRRLAVLRRVGFIRFLGTRLFPQARRLPEDMREAYRAFSLRNANTVLEEVRPVLELGIDVPESLGDLPLVVVSRSLVELMDGELAESSRLWHAHQEKLAQLSTRSAHLVAENGGRYVHLDAPDVVVEGIRQVIDMVGTR